MYLSLYLFVGLAGLLLLYSDNKFLKPITKIANNDNKDTSNNNSSLGNISHPSYSENNNITTLFPSKYHNNSTFTTTTTTTTNTTISSSELCSLVEPPPVFLNYAPTPIWIPSYPGSGSEMFRDLVKATTGLGGDNYYANKCSKEPIPFTCKTHWPVIRRYRKIQPQTMVGRFHDKAIFLIRNPRHALPSYFNHEYEVKHKLKRHSQQGSEEEWRKYRDRIFGGEQEPEFLDWKKIITEWHKQPFEIVLYIQYEELINNETGPALFNRVINEIRQMVVPIIGSSPGNTTTTTTANSTTTTTTTSSNIAPDEDIKCSWRKVVQGDNSDNGDSTQTKTTTIKTKRAKHK